MSVDEIKWNSKNTQLQKRRKGEIMEQGKKGTNKNKYQDCRVKCSYISNDTQCK